MTGAEFKAIRVMTTQDRNIQIVAMRKQGKTYQATGLAFGISSARARQIVGRRIAMDLAMDPKFQQRRERLTNESIAGRITYSEFKELKKSLFKEFAP